MVTGLTLALGTTQLATIADVWILLFITYQVVKAWPDWRSGFRTHPLVIALAALIGITALWSPDPIAPLFAAARIVMLYSIVSLARPNLNFWLLGGTVLAVQVAMMAVQLTDVPRPHGLSFTASSAGQAGLAYAVGPLAPIAAVTLGLSGARSAAMGLAVLTVASRSRRLWAIAALAAVVFVGTAVFNDRLHQDPGSQPDVQGTDRMSADGIKAGINDRLKLVAGDKPASQYVAERCGETRERAWRVYGYGYHGYCLSTGLAKPHNLWILSWWELGLLAIPFWAIVAYGAWRLRSPMVLALLAVGLITEEMFSRPEGFYIIAVAMLPYVMRYRLTGPSTPTMRPGQPGPG